MLHKLIHKKLKADKHKKDIVRLHKKIDFFFKYREAGSIIFDHIIN